MSESNNMTAPVSGGDGNGEKKKKKKGKAKIIIPIIIVVVIGLIIAWVASAVSRFKKINDYLSNMGTDIVEVKKRDLSESINLTGVIAGDSKTNVTSTAVSEIITMNVQVGDVVKEGDVICTLDSSAIQERLDKANVVYSNSEAINNNQSKQNRETLEEAKQDQVDSLNDANDAIAKAEKQYKQATTDYNNCNNTITTLTNEINALQVKATEKAQILQSPGEDTDIEAVAAEYDSLMAQIDAKKETLEEVKLSLKEYSSLVEAAKEGVDAAKKSYKDIKKATDKQIAAAQNVIDMEKYQLADSSYSDEVKELIKQLDDCTVYAPVSGVITAVNFNVGDTNQAGVAIVTIEDDVNKKLVLDVSEKDILKLSEGMDAIVTSSAVDGLEIEGRITRLVRVKSGQMDSGVSGYLCEIELSENELLLGMSGKARIILVDRPEVLTVPYDLVREAEDGTYYVMAAVDNGDGTFTSVKKTVEIGEEIGNYYEIVGGELNEGDFVVYNTDFAPGEVFTPNFFGDDYMGEDYDMDGGMMY